MRQTVIFIRFVLSVFILPEMDPSFGRTRPDLCSEYKHAKRLFDSSFAGESITFSAASGFVRCRLMIEFACARRRVRWPRLEIAG